MADSGALRQQRYKHHKAGDHHLCHHGPTMVRTVDNRLTVAEPGEFDPAAELRTLAGRLAAVHQADPANAAVARELRMTLLAIAPEEAEDPFDPIRMLQRAEWDSRQHERDQSP